MTFAACPLTKHLRISFHPIFMREKIPFHQSPHRHHRTRLQFNKL
jgi:hypothetical protein